MAERKPLNLPTWFKGELPWSKEQDKEATLVMQQRLQKQRNTRYRKQLRK